MNYERKLAIYTGTGFLLAIVFGTLGLGLTESFIQDLDFTLILENEISIKVGAIFTMFMALSVMMISLAIYPILRKKNPSLALGYVGLRFLEGFIFVINAVMLLVLVTLSKDFTDIAFMNNFGHLVLETRNHLGHVALDMVIFPIAALIMYFIFFFTSLVPKWLSVWGIAASIIYMAAAYMVLFGFEPLSLIYIILNIPLALNEVVLGLLLIIKGFNTSKLEV
jgi:hypothetical protein